MLSGYKTYITAAVAVIGALAGWAVGDLTVAAAANLVLTAVMGVFIRHGVANS